MKRKTGPRNGKKLQELRAKALRRGERLANTLRKLAAKSDPTEASVERLVKELERALPRLRSLTGQQEDLSAGRDERQIKSSSAKPRPELAVPPKSGSRNAKRRPTSAQAVAE